ncbi:hypothetical protein CWR41_04695 [Cedecea lapagei]|nr:hypothetical protein CWR41_04695 [Cedecea lapagei]
MSLCLVVSHRMFNVQCSKKDAYVDLWLQYGWLNDGDEKSNEFCDFRGLARPVTVTPVKSSWGVECKLNDLLQVWGNGETGLAFLVVLEMNAAGKQHRNK